MTGWADARLAAALFAVDPAGTGGVALRARAGAARDSWLAVMRADLPEGPGLRRVPLNVSDDRLLGGLDLEATLQVGRAVVSRGLLAEAQGGVLLMPMAERLPAGTVARLAAARDAGSRFGILALDEGAAEDERPRAALLDRLAFHLELEDAASEPGAAPADIAAARARLPDVRAEADIVDALCTTALALGIPSVRAPLLALHVAYAAAALAGRSAVSMEDAATAGRLVLAPRAVSLPAAAEPAPAEEEEAREPTEPPPPDDDETAVENSTLQDRVLEAVQAAIPAGLLAQLQQPTAARVRARTAGVSGAVQRGGARGRPAGVRAGDPRAGLRLNLIETLRAAAPWQGVRNRASAGRIQIRREDFRVTRLKQRTETTAIFVVDASGSAALNRLAEAKGAVELLLAECYIRRDRVAVVAFRGRGAQLLLPPTRSLVRAKRGLAGLPGGGGTPLAAGIDAGCQLAEEVRRRGGTPTLVFLTDGRANVARDGKGDRARASEEAGAAARQLHGFGFSVLLVDTSPRPHLPTQALATQMGARYVALPYADAAALSRTVQAAR